MTTWLIYALGGGWGHLHRALCLGRLAVRQGIEVKVLSNSPYLPFVDSQGVELIRAPLEPAESILQWFLKTPHDRLIVDTFPQGLFNELKPSFTVPTILIHRGIRSDVRFGSLFDRVIIPGEKANLPFEYLPQTRKTAPWLIRSPDELPSVEVARAILRVEEKPKTILIVTSGKLAEQAFYIELCHRVAANFPDFQVRYLAPMPLPGVPQSYWVRHYPGIELLSAVDIAIGSGGYHMVNECSALNVPLISIPFEREFDNQEDRILATFNNLIWLAYPHLPEGVTAGIEAFRYEERDRLPNYENGAIAAVDLISGI